MPEMSLLNHRIRVDGRLFRCGGGTFFVKGFTYGPFQPGAEGIFFPSPEQVKKDFGDLRALNANVVRIYHPPPEWILDEAKEAGLFLLVDIPWNKHLYFLKDRKSRQDALGRIHAAARICSGHPSVFALSVANEFAPDLIRWSGARPLGKFVNELIHEVKSLDSQLLCTFSNYPTTEYFQAAEVDFHSFNVYIHNPGQFHNYLQRLLNLTDGKPLLLAETGVDSIREGREGQKQILTGKLQTARHAGLAGAILFSYTDEWFTGGYPITDWAFGVVDANRNLKPSAEAVREIFAKEFVPSFSSYSGCKPPRVSVIVATYNGSRTLANCLRSLQRIEYPDYEIIVVNDGSTDLTEKAVRNFPGVKLINHPVNSGLSAARNTGLKAATGEIIVYTDDDCRVNEHWLTYLCDGLMHSDCVGIGGPNYLPPEDSPVARAVMASPGGPAAVLLDDQTAEHIPGCNMAFWKWALEEVGGFDPVFKRAGDDVDICWRIQQKGWKIAWHPAAFVWHYRRHTIGAYLRQQYGYGEAESLLMRKHPGYFNRLGACTWKGRIYAPRYSVPSLGSERIYRGVFGTAFFQTLYAPGPMMGLLFLTSLEYHVGVTLPLTLLAAFSGFFTTMAVVSFSASLLTCILSAWQQKLEKPKWWSRTLVAALFFLQPIYRSYARYKNRFSEPYLCLKDVENLEMATLDDIRPGKESLAFWMDKRPPEAPIRDRISFLNHLKDYLVNNGYVVRPDMGWDDFDLLVHGGFWTRAQLLTLAEPHPEGATLLRIKITTRWSSACRIIFKAGLFFTILLIAVLHGVWPWIWCILLLLPVLPLYCHFQKARLMRCTYSRILRFAGEHSLKFLPEEK